MTFARDKNQYDTIKRSQHNTEDLNMSELRYEAPKTLAAAVTLLKSAKGLSKVLAGGSDLLVQMKSGRLEPALIVDVKGIAGMTDIAAEKGGFRIGAAAPCMAVVEHKSFAKTWPGVTEAVALINKDKKWASQVYLDVSGDKKSTLAEIQKQLEDVNIQFTTTPRNVQKYADFMFEAGYIKTRPASWKDLYFPEIHDQAGS